MERYDRRDEAPPSLIRQRNRAPVANDADHGIRRPEIDSNRNAHQGRTPRRNQPGFDRKPTLLSRASDRGRSTKAMHFQDLIMALQAFWTARGCLLVQPYNSEVGAGTYNPATFLQALGPEPWNVA